MFFVFFVGEAFAFLSALFVMRTGVSYFTRDTVGGIICVRVVARECVSSCDWADVVRTAARRKRGGGVGVKVARAEKYQLCQRNNSTTPRPRS
jgi:hypothetical protein